MSGQYRQQQQPHFQYMYGSNYMQQQQLLNSQMKPQVHVVEQITTSV